MIEKIIIGTVNISLDVVAGAGGAALNVMALLEWQVKKIKMVIMICYVKKIILRNRCSRW